MGLNIGIEVQVYKEDPQPKDEDVKMVEARFFAFLQERFPEGGFGGGWVSKKPVHGNEFGRLEWDFDVRMFSYGSDFRKADRDINDMYRAIFDFILQEFPMYDGSLDCHVYYSG